MGDCCAMIRLLPRIVGARLIKTGLAVSLATGLMSLIDPTRGLVGAGVSAAIMIAPDNKVGKEWARNQFAAAFAGALAGALAARLIGWAPWLTGLIVMLLIAAYAHLGYTGAIIGGLSNCLFIMEHPDRGWEYAAFRVVSSLAGLLIGYGVNRWVLPYRAPCEGTSTPGLAPAESQGD